MRARGICQTQQGLGTHDLTVAVTTYARSSQTKVPARMGEGLMNSRARWGVVGNCWLLWEGESVLFRDLKPMRLSMFQSTVPCPCIHSRTKWT